MTLQIFLKFEIEPLLFHFAHSKKKILLYFCEKKTIIVEMVRHPFFIKILPYW